MPRYFFHYRDPKERLLADRVGSLHSSMDAVAQEAELRAKEILADELDQGSSPFAPRCIEIADEAGEIVLYLPFWAAVIRSDHGSEGSCLMN